MEQKLHIHLGPVYPCNYCSMAFINTTFLEKHKKKCIYQKLFTFFKEKLTLTKKIKKDSPEYNYELMKSKNTPFVCEYCGLDCHNKVALGRHYKVHGSISCEFCDKTFTKKSLLLTHKQIHLKGKKMFCNLCQMPFSDLDTYNIHVKSHKIFTHCEYCFKSFQKNDDMTEHLASHRGECPYECIKCNEKFKVLRKLKTHLHSHKGFKPFECGVCKKRFARFHFYNSHIRIHTGEKPFKCFLCEKSFSLHNHLKSHVKQFHETSKKDNWVKILTSQVSSPLAYKSIARKFLTNNNK